MRDSTFEQGEGMATGASVKACVSLIAGLAMLVGACTSGAGESRPATVFDTRESRVVERATGTFEVKLDPLPSYNQDQGSAPGRMSIDKQFSGDLVATSKRAMLTALTDVDGSAGYVAIELVTGTLAGRTGSFVLQHSGTMTRGTPQLTVTVVPDSGTDELVGLSGRMSVDVMGGRHSYVLEYELPALR